MNRSDMPAGLVEKLELVDRQQAELWDRAPLLPASSTPDSIVDAASALDAALQRHARSESAVLIEGWRRELVDAALGGTLVEPVRPEQMPSNARHLDWARQPDQDDLVSAYESFDGLLANRDWTTPERRASLTRDSVKRKQIFAKQFGLDVELTHEEWLEL